jgi:hypothetical protein
MICQQCKAAEATVTISQRVRNEKTGSLERSGDALHFCIICAEEYRAAQGLNGRALGDGQEKITELVRVVSVTPERTVYRLVRTDSDRVPVEWRLLTDRIHPREVGAEFRMIYTPEELEFMQGKEEFG